MKKAFEITEEKLIAEMLHQAEYGVLALCDDGKPYAVPVNFVYLDQAIYFHSSKKGKKMEILAKNLRVSFNATVGDTIIPSFFSSDDGLACPASAFFKSVIVDGTAEIVTDQQETIVAFEAMMQKLQPEGQYKPFTDATYEKMLAVVALVKINVEKQSAKFKFGQNLKVERFEQVIAYLQQRGTKQDLQTIAWMLQFRND